MERGERGGLITATVRGDDADPVLLEDFTAFRACASDMPTLKFKKLERGLKLRYSNEDDMDVASSDMCSFLEKQGGVMRHFARRNLTLSTSFFHLGHLTEVGGLVVFNIRLKSLYLECRILDSDPSQLYETSKHSLFDYKPLSCSRSNIPMGKDRSDRYPLGGAQPMWTRGARILYEIKQSMLRRCSRGMRL